MKKLAITILMVVFSIGVFAVEPGAKNKAVSKVTLSGKVLDLQSGETLTGVKVKLEGSDIIEYTDFEGNFRISDLVPGNYTLEVEYISYDSRKIEKVEVNHTTADLSVSLSPSTVEVAN